MHAQHTLHDQSNPNGYICRNEKPARCGGNAASPGTAVFSPLVHDAACAGRRKGGSAQGCSASAKVSSPCMAAAGTRLLDVCKRSWVGVRWAGRSSTSGSHGQIPGSPPTVTMAAFWGHCNGIDAALNIVLSLRDVKTGKS